MGASVPGMQYRCPVRTTSGAKFGEASIGLQTKGYSASQVDREAVSERSSVARVASMQREARSRAGLSTRRSIPNHYPPIRGRELSQASWSIVEQHASARSEGAAELLRHAGYERRTKNLLGRRSRRRHSQISDAALALGDEVGVRQVGTRAVSVTVPVRDAEGRHVGEQRLDTHRNAWVLEKAESFKERNAPIARRFHQEANLRGSEPRSDRVLQNMSRRVRELDSIGSDRRQRERSATDKAAQEAIVREYPQLAAAIARVPVGEVFERKKWGDTR